METYNETTNVERYLIRHTECELTPGRISKQIDDLKYDIDNIILWHQQSLLVS